MSDKPSQMRKLRPLGEVTSDLEPLLLELGIDHDMQWHEILGLVHAWLQTHLPEGQERYVDDNSAPEYYYGPRRAQ